MKKYLCISVCFSQYLKQVINYIKLCVLCFAPCPCLVVSSYFASYNTALINLFDLLPGVLHRLPEGLLRQ